MKQYQQLFFLLFAVSLTSVSLFFFLGRHSTAASYCRLSGQILVIDAGHGGEDGGAVSVTGTPESTINLSIALKADQLCGLYGAAALLVRQSDTSLADASATSIREKKRSDLKKRVTLVNETPNAVLLSIHQNNYSKKTSHGAQVFFHDDPTSQQWSQQMQECLRVSLDPSNPRKATMIPQNVYLMNHVTAPALLVECGFLSNATEDALLESDCYQSKLAVVLTSSYLLFFN